MASTIWKGRLNFGLVSIPIKLVRAARAEKIHMHKLERSTGSRVRQVFIPAHEPPSPEPSMPYRQPAPIREEHQQFTPATAIEVSKVQRIAKNASPPHGLASEDIVQG